MEVYIEQIDYQNIPLKFGDEYKRIKTLYISIKATIIDDGEKFGLKLEVNQLPDSIPKIKNMIKQKVQQMGRSD